MPKVDWNAPGLFYLLKYREVPDGQFGAPEKIIDPAVDVFAIPNTGIYKLWEFQIQAGNEAGLGPESPVVQSYSGQDRPKGKPGNVQTGAATARTVDLTWVPVTLTRGSVDGYKVRAASFLSFSLCLEQDGKRRNPECGVYSLFFFFFNLFSLSLKVV